MYRKFVPSEFILLVMPLMVLHHVDYEVRLGGGGGGGGGEEMCIYIVKIIRTSPFPSF